MKPFKAFSKEGEEIIEDYKDSPQRSMLGCWLPDKRPSITKVVDQAEQFLQTNSLVNYYDEVALPALLMAQVDLRRGVLDELRQRRIKETIDEVIEDLSDHVDQPPAAAPAPRRWW